MTAKLFLGSIIFIVGVYTTPVVTNYGLLTLLPSFFGEMSKMNWQGQFNLDFFMFLLMSGFWIAWRNRFSPTGIGGIFLVAPYLSAYLLYLGQRHGWDFNKVFRRIPDMTWVLLDEDIVKTRPPRVAFARVAFAAAQSICSTKAPSCS